MPGHPEITTALTDVTERLRQARASGRAVADLRFLVRGDVEPWVLSIGELTGARAEHQSRLRAEARKAAGMPADEEPRSLQVSPRREEAMRTRGLLPAPLVIGTDPVEPTTGGHA